MNRVHGKYLVGANFSRNFSFCAMRPNQIITKNKTKTTIKFLSTSKQFFMHVQQYYIIGLFALSLGWKAFFHSSIDSSITCFYFFIHSFTCSFSYLFLLLHYHSSILSRLFHLKTCSWTFHITFQITFQFSLQLSSKAVSFLLKLCILKWFNITLKIEA